MYFKRKIILACSISLFFLLSCQKKNNLTPLNPNPALVGDFYTERLLEGMIIYPYHTFPTSWIDTADVNIRCTLQDDVLSVLGFEFEVSSNNQTHFFYSDGTLGDLGVTAIWVRYADNYDSIYIKHQTPCNFYNRCNTINYAGKRGGLVTRLSSGNVYALQASYRKIETRPPFTHIDTQYTKDITINYTTSSPVSSDFESVYLEIEGNSFLCEGVSYFNHYQEAETNDRYVNIYWKNDSIYLEQMLVEYYDGLHQGRTDTVYYSYSGRKK